MQLLKQDDTGNSDVISSSIAHIDESPPEKDIRGGYFKLKIEIVSSNVIAVAGILSSSPVTSVMY